MCGNRAYAGGFVGLYIEHVIQREADCLVDPDCQRNAGGWRTAALFLGGHHCQIARKLCHHL